MFNRLLFNPSTDLSGCILALMVTCVSIFVLLMLKIMKRPVMWSLWLWIICWRLFCSFLVILMHLLTSSCLWYLIRCLIRVSWKIFSLRIWTCTWAHLHSVVILRRLTISTKTCPRTLISLTKANIIYRGSISLASFLRLWYNSCSRWRSSNCTYVKVIFSSCTYWDAFWMCMHQIVTVTKLLNWTLINISICLNWMLCLQNVSSSLLSRWWRRNLLKRTGLRSTHSANVIATFRLIIGLLILWSGLN